MGNHQSSALKVQPQEDGRVNGSRNSSPRDPSPGNSSPSSSGTPTQASGQSPLSSQREPQSPEILFSSQIHSPTRLPRRKRQSGVHKSSPSPKMERVNEIPESPSQDVQTHEQDQDHDHDQVQVQVQIPSTNPKSSSRKSKKRNSKSNTMSQLDSMATSSPIRDQAANEPQSSWAAINGSPSKNQEPKKKKRRRHRDQMQESSVINGSSDVGASPQLGNTHTNGANGATSESTLHDASTSKKRKHTEITSESPENAKQNHKSNTTDDPTSTSFSSLAESLYKNRNKKRRASIQEPEVPSEDDEDVDMDDNSDGENHNKDGDLEPQDDDGGEFEPQDDDESQDDDSTVAPTAATTTPSRRTGKRVPKSTFFEQLAEEEVNDQNGHSSLAKSESKSAKSSKTQKTQKTPKTPKTKQPKISAMMKGGTEDNAPNSSRAPHQLATGPFSEFELRNITQAVERWRDDHHMTQVEVNELIQGNPKEVKSQEFWARIIATCPNRKRQKIINQCRRKFHNFVARGTWTAEQQDELKRLWEAHGNKYALIGKIINRYAEDVRDRVRNYVICGDSRRVDPWTAEEEDKLNTIVTEALDIIREQRAEGAIVVQLADEELIDWQRVSECMERTRSRLQCMQKWKLIMRQKQTADGSIDGGPILSTEEIIAKAREEADDMPDEERHKLIKAIHSHKSTSESRIPWAKIREKAMGSHWTRPTLMLVWYRLKMTIADWDVMSIPEMLKHLSKEYRNTKKLPFPDGDDYDEQAEYLEIERKVEKILKKQSKRVAAEDEAEAEEADSEETEDEESGDSEEAGEEEPEDGSEETGEEEPEDGEEDVEEEGHDEELEDRKTPSQDSEDESEEANSSDEDMMDEESDSLPKPKRSGRDQQASSPSKTSTTWKRALAKRKAKTARELSEEDQVDEDDEVSSDTNASEASSIPARL